MLIPVVDKDLCIGCRNCEIICPEMFRLNLEGKSEVIKESGECDIQLVIDSCPVGAISLTEK